MFGETKLITDKTFAIPLSIKAHETEPILDGGSFSAQFVKIDIEPSCSGLQMLLPL